MRCDESNTWTSEIVTTSNGQMMFDPARQSIVITDPDRLNFKAAPEQMDGGQPKEVFFEGPSLIDRSDADSFVMLSFHDIAHLFIESRFWSSLVELVDAGAKDALFELRELVALRHRALTRQIKQLS